MTELEDNDPMDEYRYLLSVCTGHRIGASTSSQVHVFSESHTYHKVTLDLWKHHEMHVLCFQSAYQQLIFLQFHHQRWAVALL